MPIIRIICLCAVILGILSAKDDSPNPYTLPKDGAYYLEHNTEILNNFLEQVKKQSEERNYPFFRSRPLVEHTVYRTLSPKEKESLQGGIVLTRFFLSSFIRYSHLGGVGVGGKFTKNAENEMYFSFDGRYLSDLKALGLGREIFAYCVLPRFDKCIMLGIGEEW
ncbi:hypothetical protein LS68_003890 [Helicobacter sp. MIT 05-5293]|uniref:hypothetical protein n=1 Tax=Helicobacter sp. MIT 05-5293 TaxID=1548149 RepID=UPI00051D7D2D|nr:hypothetical protein [Helicobacter sp. MIT 05-5293]TLD82148.1 hypothetical protein LS68_003890 [Helicobacter sp. MIT 05-5293]